MSTIRPLLPQYRKSPNNAEEEYKKLEEFVAEFGRSRVPGVDFHRSNWKKAVEKYIQKGWPISISTIDKIWEHLAKPHHDASDQSGEVSKPFARDAVRILFNFSTTAIAYDDSGPLNHAGKCYEDQNDRRPRGMDLQQKVFLTELETPIVEPEPNPKPGELDRFAMAISDLDGYDGVYCLSGVRGSGKSTVLNRIAWYCQHWFYRTQRPLLVRFDLGTTFNREIFVRDLLAEICLTAKRTLRQNPFSSPLYLGWAARAFGYLGRFCQVNISWATVVAILLELLKLASKSNGNGENKTILSLSTEQVEILQCGLLGVVILGVAYFANSWIATNFRRHVRNSGSNLREKICNSVSVLILIIVLIEIFTRKPSQVISVPPDISPSFFLCIVSLFVAILFLPCWWQRYVYLDRILARIRSDQSLRLNIPLLAPMGSLGWYLARFLPTSESPEKLDEISEPFIQELIKQVLNECTNIFPRVVILVDDVDALPSTEYHSVMRLFRPMSKVSGIRCILATPLYFHYVLGEKNHSDVHSTVQKSIVVGNPAIIDHWPMQPDKITGNSEILKEFLADLVGSRLRMNLRDKKENSPLEVRDKILASPTFKFILEPWQDDKKIKELFDRLGTSRREIVRVLYEEVNGNFRDTSNPKVSSVFMKNYRNVLTELKKEYLQQETALNCNYSELITPPDQAIPKRTTRRRSTSSGSKVQSKNSP